MSHPQQFLLSLVFYLLFLTKANGDTVNTTIPGCFNNTTCGNLTIRYPFCLSGPSPVYCGYPNFNVTCTAEQKAIIHLSNDAYYVTNIDYDKNTLTLVDTDLISQKCPRVRQNVTLDSFPYLKFTALDVYLIFCFNCSGFPPFVGETEPLSCLSNGAMQSFVLRGRGTPDFDWFKYCRDSVVVPVLESEARMLNATLFGGVLEKGFSLDWNSLKDCAACEESEGNCGYYKSNGTLICFCPDGLHLSSCYRAKATGQWKVVQQRSLYIRSLFPQGP